MFLPPWDFPGKSQMLRFRSTRSCSCSLTGWGGGAHGAARPREVTSRSPPGIGGRPAPPGPSGRGPWSGAEAGKWGQAGRGEAGGHRRADRLLPLLSTGREDPAGRAPLARAPVPGEPGSLRLLHQVGWTTCPSCPHTRGLPLLASPFRQPGVAEEPTGPSEGQDAWGMAPMERRELGSTRAALLGAA